MLERLASSVVQIPIEGYLSVAMVIVSANNATVRIGSVTFHSVLISFQFFCRSRSWITGRSYFLLVTVSHSRVVRIRHVRRTRSYASLYEIPSCNGVASWNLDIAGRKLRAKSAGERVPRGVLHFGPIDRSIWQRNRNRARLSFKFQRNSLRNTSMKHRWSSFGELPAVTGAVLFRAPMPGPL